MQNTETKQRPSGSVKPTADCKRLIGMLTNSSRFLRSASNRMEDPRLSTRLRRMSGRRLRSARLIDRSVDAKSSGPSGPRREVSGENLLSALASPRRHDVLNGLLGHERQLLRDFSAALLAAPARRERRVLKRVRDGIERDVARLHTLLGGQLDDGSEGFGLPEYGAQGEMR